MKQSLSTVVFRELTPTGLLLILPASAKRAAKQRGECFLAIHEYRGVWIQRVDYDVLIADGDLLTYIRYYLRG